jgi:hypothetical protein
MVKIESLATPLLGSRVHTKIVPRVEKAAGVDDIS